MNVDFLVLTADNGSNDYTNSLGLRNLGPHKISWIAREHGYTSIVIGKLQLLNQKQILALCEPYLHKKTVIGLSTTFLSTPGFDNHKSSINALNQCFLNIKNVLSILKTRGHKIIVGGPFIKNFRNHLEADYFVQGPAENELPKILDRIFRSGIQKKPYDWNITTCKFQYSKYDLIQPKEILPLEMSRGCIFKCKFCGWQEIGKRKGTFETNINNIKDHLISNFDKFGTTYYNIVDDTFNDDDDKMNEWCDMLETLPFKIKYSCYLRLDLCHRYPATTKRLYQTGLRGCNFGIETFHPEASKAIGKAFNGKKAKDFLPELFYDIFEKNVCIVTTNIVGLPGEDEKFVFDSVDWYNKNRYIMSVYNPLFMNKSYGPEDSPSEFASEYQKYGYSFPDPEKPIHWINSIMDYKTAFRISNEANSRLIRKQALNSWTCLLQFSVSDTEPKDYLLKDTTELQRSNIKKIHELNNLYFDAIRKQRI
jgi:radical SAM superfamily enzyme YgiQ (UPF0313 family)